jgi:hypothetical protein
MDIIIPLFILALISTIFVRGIIRYAERLPGKYVGRKHNCNKHELYFEDELSRGTFCGVCNKTIDEEFFNLRNKSGEINHENPSN